MPADRGTPVAAGPVLRPAPSRPAPRAAGAPPSHTDITSSGPSYGRARANAYKATPAYHQAVTAVFKAQPTKQKAAIVRGIVTQPGAFKTPEGQAVMQAMRGLPIYERTTLAKYLPHPQGIDLGAIPKALAGGINVLRESTQIGSKGPGNVATFGQMGEKVAKNATSDLVNLPGEAVSTAGTLGADVATGNAKKALSDLVGPYAQLVKHPAQAFIEHPLLTTLMATGALHGATRLAAAPVRALAPESGLGRAVSTRREGVALTGNLTHERPPYSLSPTIKSQQRSIENSLYTRAPTGELVPRSPQLRNRLLNKNIGELVGVNERIRRVNREHVIAQREKAIRPSRTARAAHNVKTALAYGPQRAAIPGADVLARIADATIRRPDTITADLEKHLAQVSATRHELLDDPKALKAHDAYVKQLTAALGNKAFLRNPAPAFKAAKAYAKDYAPVEARAAALGHFGQMSADALQRRSLMHYAVTHMGAKMDPERGLVGAGGAALSNAAILEHLKGAQGTGGRIPAYTPDRVRFDQGRSSFYVSSARRPLPTTKANTLYAYTHGLTSPGHEALTEQHVLMRGVVDAHHAQNRYLETLATQKPGGGYWDSFAAAKRDAPPGYRPVNISQPFHGAQSLEQAVEGVSPASIEEEAMRHSLDLSARLQGGTKGRWAIIDQQALKALRDHQNQISPNTLLRTIRGLNNQFRTVALSTSAKHVPGVVQENLIRDIAQGVGFRSWLSGRRLVKRMEQANPERGGEIRTQLTGGQLAGMTEAGKTYRVSDHWAGTSVYPVLRAFEASVKAPALRQVRGAWNAWTHFAIRGTKRALEQQHQLAGLGKAALREHGYAEAARNEGFMGLVQRAFGLHGKLLDDAARGMFDPAKARQMRAVINQMYGKWTDLSPGAQTALMFSPFGLWWANSVKFLARMPVDQPVKTSLLASATAGTEQERRAHGLDMLMPGALPLYEQGGIPVDGKIVAQNYYSPFGVANNPLETGASLIQPWALPMLQGAGGVDYLWRPLTSPGNPHGSKQANVAQRAQYILNSALASFVPLYTKAQQATEGGASPYDVTNKGALPPLLTGHAPPTKKPGKGVGAGLAKALLPVREYKIATPKASKRRSGGYLLDGGSGSGTGSSGSGYLLP